jgi:hypothetical protein
MQHAPVPPAFAALHAGPRGRSLLGGDELAARHETCEDMAQQLQDLARRVHRDVGVDEAEVLARIRRGLDGGPLDLRTAEADWVVRRLAELLGWAQPQGLATPPLTGREPAGGG